MPILKLFFLTFSNFCLIKKMKSQEVPKLGNAAEKALSPAQNGITKPMSWISATRLRPSQRFLCQKAFCCFKIQNGFGSHLTISQSRVGLQNFIVVQSLFPQILRKSLVLGSFTAEAVAIQLGNSCHSAATVETSATPMRSVERDGVFAKKRSLRLQADLLTGHLT